MFDSENSAVYQVYHDTAYSIEEILKYGKVKVAEILTGSLLTDVAHFFYAKSIELVKGIYPINVSKW